MMNWGGTGTTVALRVVDGGLARERARRLGKRRARRRASLWIDWLTIILLGAGGGVAGMLQIAAALSGR